MIHDYKFNDCKFLFHYIFTNFIINKLNCSKIKEYQLIDSKVDVNIFHTLKFNVYHKKTEKSIFFTYSSQKAVKKFRLICFFMVKVKF